MQRRHDAIRLLLTLALPAGLLVAGCGDDDAGVAAGTSPQAENGMDSPGDAALAYAQCMREEGIVDFPDPQVSEGQVGLDLGDIDPDDPAVRDAQEACRSLLDQGGTFDAGDEDRQADMQTRFLAFAQCMRDNGIDFPDPEFDGGQVLAPPSDGYDPQSAEFKSALSTCQVELDGLGVGLG